MRHVNNSRCSKESALVLIFISFALMQCTWHWLLTLGGPLSTRLLQLYLRYQPGTHRTVAGCFDLFIPTVLLALIIGFLGWNWSMAKLAICIIFANILLVALLPAYVLCLRGADVWWWKGTSLQLAEFMFSRLVSTFAILCFFVLEGYAVGRYMYTGEVFAKGMPSDRMSVTSDK